MFTAALVMALAGTFTEIKLVHGSAGLRKVYMEGYLIKNLKAFSIVGGCVVALFAPTIGGLIIVGSIAAIVTGKMPQQYRVEPILVNTIVSVVLSYIMGALFSATGVTVAIAAAISTGLSQAYFSGENFIAGKELNIGAKMQGIKDGYNTAAAVARDFKQPVLDFAKIVLWTLRAITFPFAIARKLSVAYTERKSS